MHLISLSLLPGCLSPLSPALIDSLKRLLELVLWMKASLLGPMSHLYIAVTATEPFLPTLSCLHDRIVSIHVNYTIHYYLLLKIFLENFRGFSQPQKFMCHNI